MKTLIFNNRDELLKIKPNDIVYFQADGNYTKLVLTTKELLLTVNLSKIQKIIEKSDILKLGLFVRVGKSLIIHKAYIFKIQILNCSLVLKVPNKDFYYDLHASKEALKKLKESEQRQSIQLIPNIYLRDKQTQIKYHLKFGNNYFGRKSEKSDCENQIDNGDRQISRIHFNILIKPQLDTSDFHRFILDLKSSNGTFINEKLIPSNEAIQIEIGAIIRAGKTNFALESTRSDITEIP